MTSSTEQTETVANPSAIDTSTDVVPANPEQKPVNGNDEEPTAAESNATKRKRSTKKAVETTDSVPNERPKRTFSKRK